jgi:hypothetical protein
MTVFSLPTFGQSLWRNVKRVVQRQKQCERPTSASAVASDPCRSRSPWHLSPASGELTSSCCSAPSSEALLSDLPLLPAVYSSGFPCKLH